MDEDQIQQDLEAGLEDYLTDCRDLESDVSDELEEE